MDIKVWLMIHPTVSLMSMFAALGSLIALIFYRKSHPLNIFLLGIFTIFEAHGIASIVTHYSSTTILKAVIVTFVIFVSLSAYTFQTKYDFTSWQPYLYGSLWVIAFFL